MTDDITKTAGELLDALPGWQTWEPDVVLVLDADSKEPELDVDPWNERSDADAHRRASAIAALPRTVAALVEEVERLRVAASEGLTKADAFVASEVERARAEVDRLRMENDALRAKAAEVPGLSAALDEARFDRDVALGRQTERGQALREIDRLVIENESLRRGMDQMRLLAGLPVTPEVARDAALGRAVREIVSARDRRIADPIAYLEDAAYPHTLGGEILLALARVLREEASDG